MSKKSKSKTGNKMNPSTQPGMSDTFKAKIGNGSTALNSNNMPKR